MSKPCIVNVAINYADTAEYPKYQRRLKASVERHAPGASLMFWTNSLPLGSPTHTEVPYGFKLYAINEARKAGADVVLWLDSSIYAIRSLKPIFDLIEKDGIYFIEDSAAMLGRFCNDRVLAYYGISRDQAMDVPLIAGSIMGFDFSSDRARLTYDALWFGMQAGCYAGTVSSGSGIEDHRGDEAILGCLFGNAKYPRHFIGEHFAADQEPFDSTILRSGYYDREAITEHTVMKPVNGPVLDVGARGMTFAKAMARRGCQVYCMDPDRDLMGIEGMTYYRAALVGTGDRGRMMYISSGNGSANHLAKYGREGSEPDRTQYAVNAMDITDVMELSGVKHWGLVKLDCEGAEFDILRRWPGPIADQLSVEFHDHTGANPYPNEPERVYGEILGHLCQWYRVVQHERSERHCLKPANYWDSVFVLKDL